MPRPAGARATGSVEIEIACGLRDRFLVRLAQSLFEAARQRVAAVLLRVNGLLKNRLPASRLFGEDALRVAQFRLVATFGFVMGDHSSEIEVDDENRLATGAGDFEL